jgi:ERCC4-type nuclease
MSDFTIIIDTREQKPWEFYDKAVAHRKLDTGDYSIEGMEDILCIERKRGIAEIALNVTEKRFKDFIERMGKYKHAYILIEADYKQLMNYPLGSGIPTNVINKVKMTPQFILKCLNELSINHGIHVIFCGCASWAETTAYDIMKRVYKKYVSEDQE